MPDRSSLLRIDERARARGRAIAEDVDDPPERYVADPLYVDQALDDTFGAVASTVVPSRDEWDRG